VATLARSSVVLVLALGLAVVLALGGLLVFTPQVRLVLAHLVLVLLRFWALGDEVSMLATLVACPRAPPCIPPILM
jgi:hypothetical protein